MWRWDKLKELILSAEYGRRRIGVALGCDNSIRLYVWRKVAI